MKVFKNPSREEWDIILARPRIHPEETRIRVGEILRQVRRQGDRALRELTRQFDGVDLTDFQVNKHDIDASRDRVSENLKKSMDTAISNIRAFHAMQKPGDRELAVRPGVRCWIRSVPIEKVGLYVPGGSAPLLSTVLMLGIPAKLAGCREIILCTPPGKDGNVHPAILYSASRCGIGRIFRIGGAQAIAAMAYGTESIPGVDKIFGPGNLYVTLAKQLVSLENVAIDMPAGPSEVAVIADESAEPEFVAADLLSQAEHGMDSQVILLTTDSSMPGRVNAELESQLQELPRGETAQKALEHSRCIYLDNKETLIELVNLYAPEHLIIITRDYRELSGRILNAGSVFLGPYTPESAGDYASGTNHTLPTGGYARAYSGLGLESFMKKISFQELDESGLLELGPVIMEMAGAEELEAHRQAVRIRLDHIMDKNK